MDFLKQFSVCRLLASAVGGICLLAAVFYFAVLSPRQEEIRSSRKDLQQLYQRVRSKDYPVDRAALEKIRAELIGIQKGSSGKPGIEEVNRTLLQRAEKIYQGHIRQRYGSRRDFIQRVTRLDFQEEYDSLMAAFRKTGLRPDPNILGISEKSASVYTYQLMLQLWTLEAVRDCVAEAGMEFCCEKKNVPEIAILPMRAYMENASAKAPFLLEFPVKLALEGSFAQMRKLMTMLLQDPYFLPVRHFEIFSLPPSSKKKQGMIRLKLECAGYFTWEKQQN